MNLLSELVLVLCDFVVVWWRAWFRRSGWISFRLCGCVFAWYGFALLGCLFCCHDGLDCLLVERSWVVDQFMVSGNVDIS